MQPTPSDVFVNLPLTNLSVAFMQQATDFVATQVFPTVPSELPGHLYFIWNRDDWYRIGAQYRAAGTESAGSGFSLSQDSFFCKPYAIHKDIDDQILATQVAPINIEMSTTRWVTLQLMLKREALWVSSFFKTGIWGTDVTGVGSGPSTNQVLQWDLTGSDPITDVDTQIWKMKQLTGYKPNVGVITPDIFQTLKNHPAFLERVKYTQLGVVTEDLIATLFGLDKIMVASAIQTTSAEVAIDTTTTYGLGAPGSHTYDFIAGTGAMLLAYAAPDPGLDVPSAGYTFTWTGYIGAGTEGNRIKSFRIEARESTRIEGSLAIDPHVVAKELGVFFTSLHS